ncbi:unnamed protein product, partial [Discosporangium mesarthrocarpum]
MKDLDTQSGPIVGLTYCSPEKAVLVACQDGEMMCYDEMDPEKAVLLTTFEGGGSVYTDDLQNMAVSFPCGLVATSSCNIQDGIHTWNFATGRQEDVIHHKREEAGTTYSILSLTFLEPYPLLLASYSDGNLRLWGVKGSPLKGSCILTFPNRVPEDAEWWGEEDSEYPLLRFSPEIGDDTEGKGDSSPKEKNTTPVGNGFKGAEALMTPLIKGAGGGLRGEGDFVGWRVQPRLTPRMTATLQVFAAAWDTRTARLFTGDESGRLRCWDLSTVIGPMQARPPEAAGSVREQPLEGGDRVGLRHQVSRTTSCSSMGNLQNSSGVSPFSSFRTLDAPSPRQLHRHSVDLPTGATEFLWGVEGAHDDAINLLRFVQTDPPALLTSGVDRCVKMWTLDGRPQGLLLQGLAPHAPNPRWSFRINLDKLEDAERAEMKEVLERIDRRKEEQAAQDRAEAYREHARRSRRRSHSRH